MSEGSKRSAFLLIPPLLAALGGVAAAAGKSPVDQPFSCGDKSASASCATQVACPAGYRITHIKAACAFDLPSAGKGARASLAGLPDDRVSVVASSQSGDSSCYVAKSAADGAQPSAPVLAHYANAVGYGCHEGDADGREHCRIDGVAHCEWRPSTPVRDIKFLTYNIAGATFSDVTRIANVIRSESPDVVALQEVHYPDPTLADGNQAEYIANQLGMYFTYQVTHASRSAGAGGNALLSRFPFVDVENVRLPKGSPDRRGGRQDRYAIAARVIPDWGDPGRDFIVLATHVGTYDADDPVRSTPARIFTDYVERPDNASTPVVLMGDLNDRFSKLRRVGGFEPDQSTATNLTSSFNFNDHILPSDQRGSDQFDYVLFKGRGVYEQIPGRDGTSESDIEASDHRPVYRSWRPVR
jgi:endonuclease/exonuclease/phosphatase family metal-dependent hydrolase